MREPCVLLKLGEVVLTGRNQQFFERLPDNIRRSVQDLGVGIRVRQRAGVIVLRTSPATPPAAARRAVSPGQPGTVVHVEVDQREIVVYTDGSPGQGGLPVGMSGRALVLASGGIDSPVAAYRLMRRGLRCGYLHFSGLPLTGPEPVYQAYALVRQLDRFQGDSRLFLVAFGNAQRGLDRSTHGAGDRHDRDLRAAR